MQQLTYFLSERPAAGANAGSKARNDAEAVLRTMGCQPFEHLEEQPHIAKWRKFLKKASLRYQKKLLHLRVFGGHRLVLQYPFYCDRITIRFLRRLVRQNRTILVVHDVDTLRSFGAASVAEELAVFRSAAVLIVHNAQMAAALRARGIDTPMVELGVFDYLLDAPYPARDRRLAPSVAFAGNLQKSRFLHADGFQDLPLDVHLYGNGFSPAELSGERIHYHGAFPSDRIPYELDGSFGLIWDGDSLGSCTGAFGQYLKYNDPHKLSLYIASGLPVITWRQAAIAKFIEERGIGFAVEALTEIPEKIASLTETDYDAYRTHLRALQQDVCQGAFMRRALARAIDMTTTKNGEKND